MGLVQEANSSLIPRCQSQAGAVAGWDAWSCQVEAIGHRQPVWVPHVLALGQREFLAREMVAPESALGRGRTYWCGKKRGRAGPTPQGSAGLGQEGGSRLGRGA